jgi:hypothetical protein
MADLEMIKYQQKKTYSAYPSQGKGTLQNGLYAFCAPDEIRTHIDGMENHIREPSRLIPELHFRFFSYDLIGISIVCFCAADTCCYVR